MDLTKQEQQMLKMIRGSADAKEEFQFTVAFEEGRWSVVVSKLPHGARNKIHGEGDTFDEAWSNMSPLWK